MRTDVGAHVSTYIMRQKAKASGPKQQEKLNKAETVLDFARIVQIGWAIGPVDMSTPVIVKTALIQPSDFTIAEKATNHHGISHNYASQEGRPLQELLKEFMVDVLEAQARGGRLCAHQLETVDGRN